MAIEVDTDQVLWERLRRQEPEALRELFGRYVQVVHAFAARRSGSYALADEVVQATFVSAWFRFVRGDPGPLEQATARSWLLGIASNEIRNLSRARRRLTRLLSRQPVPVPMGDHADAVVARVDSERQIAEVRAALRRLPRHERETVELVYWAELTVAEAAAMLGVAEGTVKARLFRARQRLRPTFQSEPAEYEEQS